MIEQMDGVVPESVLQRSRRNKENAILNSRMAKKVKTESERRRSIALKRAEFYVRKYTEKEREIKRLKQMSRKKGEFYVPEEPKLAFVIRIRGTNQIAPKPRKILQLLRLIQINNGVFVRLSAPMMEMLRIVEPYVAYGYPSLKNVRELIYKRGYARIDNQRIPIVDNLVIESALGHLGIICVEDVVDQIFTVGPHFKQVNRFLWPFQLSSPRGGMRGRKTRHFINGGESGNQEEEINKLIKKMN